MSSHQKVLLTGATGHVGGRLFRHLAEASDLTVRAAVRSPISLPSWAASAEVIVGDLSQSSVRAEALLGVNAVVHLATRGFSAALGPSQADLEDETKTTISLASQAVEAGVSRFFFLSSIHVYGSSLVGTIDDDTVTLPLNAYGSSRLEIERQLFSVTAGTSTQAYVIRMTNSFGSPALPRPETWNLLIHDLCRQVVERSRITLRSDPRTCRDVIALRDVVMVIAQLISSNHLDPDVYLLASGRSMQIGDIAELVKEQAASLLGIRPSIECPVSDEVSPAFFELEPRKLRAAGIRIPNNRDAEVCDLLSLALREFGTQRT